MLYKALKIQRRNWQNNYGDDWQEKNKERKRLLGNKCENCNAKGDKSNPLHLDHIIELSKGGGNQLSNLRILCKNCHSLRHKSRF